MKLWRMRQAKEPRHGGAEQGERVPATSGFKFAIADVAFADLNADLKDVCLDRRELPPGPGALKAGNPVAQLRQQALGFGLVPGEWEGGLLRAGEQGQKRRLVCADGFPQFARQAARGRHTDAGAVRREAEALASQIGE